MLNEDEYHNFSVEDNCIVDQKNEFEIEKIINYTKCIYEGHINIEIFQNIKIFLDLIETLLDNFCFIHIKKFIKYPFFYSSLMRK